MNINEQTILLVEDNEDDAHLIRSAFRNACICNPFIIVATADEAMVYLGDGTRDTERPLPMLPVFVLLDLALATGSGFKLLQWIKSNPWTYALPVIVITGSLDPKAKESALELGATHFVQKSLRMEDLLEVVKAVGGSWVWRTGGTTDLARYL